MLKMHSRLLVGTLFALYGPLARCDTSFLQPPAEGPPGNYRDNPSYDVGERIDVQWTSDLDFMDLILWQDYPDAGNGQNFFIKLLDNTRSTSLIWEVSFDFFSKELDDGEDSVFSFTIYKNGVNEIVSTSHYFNVTFQDPTTTTSQTTQPGTTSAASQGHTSTESSATSSATDTTETAASQSDEGSDTGLSTGAVAGIAVGATIGGIALLAGLGFLAWKHFRGKKDSVNGSPVNESTVPQGPQGPPVVTEYYKPEPQFSPSFQNSQVQQERSELGDSPWTPPSQRPPHGPPQVQGVGGLHEAP